MVGGMFELVAKVSVNVGGIFSTILPDDAIEFLESRGIILSSSPRHRNGYYSNSNYDNLMRTIKDDFHEALSMKEISSKTVIRYSLATTVAYCMNGEEIVPNDVWENFVFDDYN